jgi:hypothetical protein
MGAAIYVRYTILILFLSFTGWGQQEDAYGWLRAGEDMSGVPWNFNF